MRQHDPEETVRMEVVNAMLSLANKDLKGMPEELMGFIKERTLDKKVREICFDTKSFSQS